MGDRLFVTGVERIRRCIAERSAEAILIRLDRVEAVSGTMEADPARKSGMRSVVSREGGIGDVCTGDQGMAAGTGLIETGSACRTDRIAEFDLILRIEERPGAAAFFAGTGALSPFMR